MASSFPPSCSRVMRSCSCCFCVLSSFSRFSMARFSHQREKRIPPTTNATTTRAAEVYSVGFLKKGLDCVSGSAGMVTPVTREALALGSHVIAAQLAQSIGHKFSGNALAPSHIEIGVVQRLGNSSRDSGGLGNRFRIKMAPQERFRRVRRNQRTGRCRAYYDSRILDHTLTGKARRGSYGQYGEVERTATAQLPVRALPAVERIQQDFGEDFIGPAPDVVDAVIVVELGKRDFTLAGARDQADTGAKSDQRRRGVRGGDCHAFRTSRRDPARGSVFLQAKVNCLSPFVVLIVVVAAGVQAEVSAEGRHVSNVRRGHQCSGLR